MFQNYKKNTNLIFSVIIIVHLWLLYYSKKKYTAFSYFTTVVSTNNFTSVIGQPKGKIIVIIHQGREDIFFKPR
jgi:hypothetical protein